MIRKRKGYETEYEFLGKKGHYYWRELPSGRIVVSDESADGLHQSIGDPWATDDGLLYLDEKWMKAFPEVDKWVNLLPKRGYTIPLLLPQGDHSGTPASVDEFFFAIGLARGGQA